MSLRVLPLALACVTLWAQSPKFKAWVGVHPPARETPTFKPFNVSEPILFRIPVFHAREGRSTRLDRLPGAVVEVWGDASWARQDEFKAFVRANLPVFRTAFDVGTAASVGGAMLSDLMSHPGDLHNSPLVWSPVWFNATDPWARDRRFYK